MASVHSGGVIHHQNNINVHLDGASVGKTNAFKSLRNRGLGARKPLGDLSNAATPVSTLALKKQNSKTVSFIEKVSDGVSKKKSAVSKGQEKAAPKTVRKALSDISNSGKPHSHHTSKKNQGLKLSSLPEEKIYPTPQAVVEERFLHNHHECVKAQTKALDMDEFLKTIGLDNGHHIPLTSPLPSKAKPASPLKYLELDEMDEPPLEEDQLMPETELPDILHSPPHWRTPKSATRFAHPWDYSNSYTSFVLTETPKLSKH